MTFDISVINYSFGHTEENTYKEKFDQTFQDYVDYQTAPAFRHSTQKCTYYWLHSVTAVLRGCKWNNSITHLSLHTTRG